MTTHIATIALVLIACTPTSTDPTGPRIWDYCDFDQAHPEFGLADCLDFDDGPGREALDPLKFCCHPDTNVCAETQALGDCDPDDYLVICEWGMSNADGSITCYD